MGLVFDQHKKPEKALKNFTKALELAPDNPVYLQNRACCLRSLGRYEESLVYFEKALKLDPNNIQIYSNLGYFY